MVFAKTRNEFSSQGSRRPATGIVRLVSCIWDTFVSLLSVNTVVAIVALISERSAESEITD